MDLQPELLMETTKKKQVGYVTDTRLNNHE